MCCTIARRHLLARLGVPPLFVLGALWRVRACVRARNGACARTGVHHGRDGVRVRIGHAAKQC